MAKRHYTWFIRPLDAHTNETISRELDALALTEENFNQVQICEGKTKYNVIEIPSEIIDYLLRSKDYLNLEFKLYIKEGRNGKIKEANWLHCRKKRPRTTVKN